MIRLVILGLAIWFVFFSLPSDLFESPKSIAIYDRNNQLLFASVASDEQWRFPKIDSVSEKVKQSVIYYEDEYFLYHVGINPVSIIKSIITNMRAHDIKRGGSTITMQTIRLLHQNPPRTYWQKLREIIMALRLELFNRKHTILEYYVSNAPYGGNIVGIETASWRYFNKSSHQLSWAEAATLAVLPNQPSYIYPGKNQKLLLKKRNLLLKKLFDHDVISDMDYQLALEENLPTQTFQIPQKCYHLSTEIDPNEMSGVIHTTLDKSIQIKVQEIIDGYQNIYKQNQINNAAALVIDAQNGEVLAYVGNVSDTVSGNKINMIRRPRSSGSTLKPLLYAHMIDEGLLCSQSLIQDIPIDINGYEPENNSHHFDGLVRANQALSRSLNIPWILSLKKYGYEKFYNDLKDAQFKHFDKSAKHYGLSLVVGGGETNLWELANLFFNFSNRLLDKPSDQITHFTSTSSHSSDKELNISKGATWLMMEALTEVIRPENEENWQYRQSQKLAWKTGTSHGFRDAWAVGSNPNYIIAVWVGNAEGNGRAGLTGIKKAAPILFDILNALPTKKTTWYTKPIMDLKKINVCQHSGYLPNENCEELSEVEIPLHSNLKEKCPYHTKLFLDQSLQYQVNKTCFPEDNLIEYKWFQLPLIEENYYKIVNPLYKTTPPIHPDCIHPDQKVMDIVFPIQNAKIILSTSSISNQVVFQAIHRIDTAHIHWFIDNEYIATTQSEHKVSYLPRLGSHQLTIQDRQGNFLTRRFSVKQ